MPTVAESVAIDDAARTLMVDGKPFPWPISESGPAAHQLSDELYEVRVEIFAHNGFSCAGASRQPVIAGIEFPWYITESGVNYHVSRGELPIADLAFMARAVVGIDTPHIHADEVHDLTGFVFKRSMA